MRGGAFWLCALGSTLGALGVIGCASAPTAASTARAEPTWTAAHVERAQPRLREHGLSLRPRTLSIVVHDDIDAFRADTGQSEPALRAWTTFHRMHLLHPRHWGDDSETTRTQRITHELCHAALLHHFADEAAARAARVPRFFTEGVCTVVAGQERLPLAEIVARAPDELPLTIDAFERDPEVAYAASTALARLLVEEHGPLVFTRVLSAAAREGGPGCVERALLEVSGDRDVPALWQRVVDTVAGPT